MALLLRHSQFSLFIYTLTILLTSLSPLTLTSALPAGPPSLRTTVREYLENGGHAKVQRALNLPEHVYYDPTIFFTRDDAYIRRDGEVIPHPITAERHSDLDLIRAMGLYVPGVDSEETIRMPAASVQCANSNIPPTRLQGSKSTIDITYSPNTPSDIKIPVEAAVDKWTEEFESEDVIIRICFVWGGLEEAEDKQTLGTTNTAFYFYGNDHDKLQNGSVYNPALASALQGEDLVAPDQYHVRMLLNHRIQWHLDIGTRAPAQTYDLSTTVLHELTHGLFFSGTIEAPEERRSASYMEHRPGRFDTFINVEDDIGIARACNEGVQLYNAVTSPHLRFYDRFVGAKFGLFSPWPFSSGSSVYHFNNTESLNKECEELGIGSQDCSDLMTHELVYEYTQRSIGETTLRVYRAIRSNGDGSPAGRKCDVPENSNRPGVSTGSTTPFTLPLWAIITVAVVGGIGAILVLGVVISSITGGGGGGGGGGGVGKK